MPLDIGGFQITAGMEDNLVLPILSGLVLYLDAGKTSSYSGSGTTWYDLSGNGYNGTLINGPTYNSANGGSIVFDGTDDYASLTYSPGTSANISIITWNYLGSTSLKGAFLKVGGGANGFAMGVGGTSFDNNGNQFIGLYPGVVWIPTGDNLGTGWVMTSMIMNASSQSSFYINDTLVHSYSTYSPKTPTSNSYIARNVGDEPVGARAFGGRISNVIIYNRALSSTEIAQNYIILKGRFGL
jgi:hypothetical protein